MASFIARASSSSGSFFNKSCQALREFPLLCIFRLSSASLKIYSSKKALKISVTIVSSCFERNISHCEAVKPFCLPLSEGPRILINSPRCLSKYKRQALLDRASTVHLYEFLRSEICSVKGTISSEASMSSDIIEEPLLELLIIYLDSIKVFSMSSKQVFILIICLLIPPARVRERSSKV